MGHAYWTKLSAMLPQSSYRKTHTNPVKYSVAADSPEELPMCAGGTQAQSGYRG